MIEGTNDRDGGDAAEEARDEQVEEARDDQDGRDVEAAHGTGDDRTTDELREQLAQMREEADHIATLGTGDDQVEAAERFAEDAGKLDERIGAAAREADEDRSS